MTNQNNKSTLADTFSDFFGNQDTCIICGTTENLHWVGGELGHYICTKHQKELADEAESKRQENERHNALLDALDQMPSNQ